MERVFGVVSGILTLLLILHRYLSKSRKKVGGAKPVPVPRGAWPILGHLPLLNSRKKQRFKIISELSDEYGPVFELRLGFKPVVFVNTWETAKECFTVNDKALAARPPATTLGKYICHNDAYFGVASGAYWRETRKITMQDLLSPTKLLELKQFQISEVSEFIKELYNYSTINNKVVLSDWFSRQSVNMITMLIARKRYSCDPANDDSSKVHEAIKDLLFAFALPVISDAFPCSFLEWLDPQGHIRMMKRISKQLDEVVDGWIDEHKHRSMPHHQLGQEDFIDVLLREVGKGKLDFDNLYSKHIIISSTIETIIVGAVDTTSVAMTWMVALLLKHPKVMNRAKEELDRVVGNDRWVDEADIESLAYVNAIIKETMRLYPPASLSPPHYAVEDCIIGGYQVKKGTKLLCNMWKLQRDPRVWSEDAEEFKPERHLLVEQGKQTEFTYIPFGAGRRVCPGKDLVMRVMPLTLARLLQGFRLSLPEDQPLDMSEGFAATLHKAVPLQVVVRPCLPPHMYLQ